MPPSSMEAHERYCGRCGAALEDGAGNAGPRTCASCGAVHWRDPKLAAGVLVVRDGRVLLVQRNHEPGLGLWSFPSGFVDRGEVVEEAAAREALEEAGVRVAITRLLGVFSERDHPVVFVMYGGTTSDEPVPGPEALDVGFFAPEGLPPLAFAHDPAIIEAWIDSSSAP